VGKKDQKTKSYLQTRNTSTGKKIAPPLRASNTYENEKIGKGLSSRLLKKARLTQIKKRGPKRKYGGSNRAFFPPNFLPNGRRGDVCEHDGGGASGIREKNAAANKLLKKPKKKKKGLKAKISGQS